MLLSRISGDPTVGSLRGKKESCSTRKGLRVSTRFKEFRQTPRGRGFSLLGFILCLRTMLMLGLVEAVRGRLIGPKLGTELFGFMEPRFTVRDCSQTFWVSNGVIHAVDCVVRCVRPGSAEKHGFNK